MNNHITASRQVHVWLHDGGVSTATIAAPTNATAAAAAATATRSTGGGSGVTVPLLVASQSVRRRRKGGQEHCIVPKVAFLATLLNAPLSTDRPSTAAAPTVTTISREQREEMDEQEEQQQRDGQHLPPRPGAVQFQLPGQDDNEPQSRRHHNQLQQSFTESDDPDEERYGVGDAEEEQEWVLFVQQHGRPEGFWGHTTAAEEASSSERRRRRRLRRLYLSNSNHPSSASSSGRVPLNHHHHPLLNTDAYSRIHPAVPTALAALDCVAVLVAILSSTWDDVLSPVIIVLAGFVSNMLFFIAVTWRSGIWLQTAVLLLLTLNVLVLFRLQVMDILLSRLLLVAGQMICVARMRTFAELSVYFLT